MESVSQILQTKDLLPGSYLIESYELKKSSYSIYYLVCAENESKGVEFLVQFYPILGF